MYNLTDTSVKRRFSFAETQIQNGSLGMWLDMRFIFCRSGHVDVRLFVISLR